MRAQRVVLLFGLVLIAVAVFLLVSSLQNTTASDDIVPMAPGDFEGAASCQRCHLEEYSGWRATDHAQVFEPGDPFLASFLSRGAPDSCQPCHVVGYGKPQIGGYNSSLPWNSSYNTPLLGIQCENCHGADTMNLTADQRIDTASMVCAQCHYGSRRPQFDEWNASAHGAGAPSYAQRLECAECHEAGAAGAYLSTGQAPTSLPANPRWQLTCSTCHDPHDATQDRLLRRPVQELCASCHTSEGTEPGAAVHHPQAEMRNGAASVPVPPAHSMSAVYCVECHMFSYAYDSAKDPPAMSGHSFQAKPEACVSCHDGTSGFRITVEQAETAIHGWQEATHLRLEAVKLELKGASDAINAAEDHGFDPATIGQAMLYYDQANYSAGFVEADGSMGAHNFGYAANLLAHADLRSGQVVAMLTPGGLSGVVVDADGTPLQGVQLMRAGKVWATSGADGRFSFLHAPGSFTFILVQDGKEVGTLDAVIVAGQTSDVRAMAGPAAATGPTAATEALQYATLLLLLVAIVLMVVLIARRKAVPTVPKEPEPEPEVYEEAK